MFALRTGRFVAPETVLGKPAGVNLQLKLSATYKEADFDREWQSMGAYASWRAAMYGFMFPENILLPALRSDPTAAFVALLETLRATARLSPSRARAEAASYLAELRTEPTITLPTSLKT